MLLDDLEAKPRIAVARLEALYRREAGRPRFARDVAEAVASGVPALERGGAWLLERMRRDGRELPASEWELVLEALGGVRDWVARLELCQLLSRHPRLLADEPAAVVEFVRACARDPKPFVRAWGLTALHALGERHAAYRAEARRALKKAEKDPAKSVRARVRRVKDLK